MGESNIALDFSINISKVPGIKEEMLLQEFWLSKIKNGSKLIMDLKHIKAFNEEIIKRVDNVYDLEKYKESLTKEELLSFIKEYKLPDKTMYDDEENLLTEHFFNSIIENTNLSGIKEENKIKYGITVKKVSIRSFPTEVGVYEYPGNTVFDRFQETGCGPCEAVLILHKSSDNLWYFIQMYNYRGWAKAEGIAVAKEKAEVFDYINSEEFVMVTGNHVSIDGTTGDVKSVNTVFNMGNKLSIAKDNNLFAKYNQEYYIVKLPSRHINGALEFKYALISKNKDVRSGFLPYTRENIIKQAFKLQGDRYDWGNKYNGKDCSSFIACIYKTFGFLLPRNTGEQERCPGKKYILKKK